MLKNNVVIEFTIVSQAIFLLHLVFKFFSIYFLNKYFLTGRNIYLKMKVKL